ncbi:hypothetical protein CONLIGDRAFT_648963 [Coniochaeta ligniaria NRRL 30616]|uniref:Uncharacterized protein n=1 Tax=Coniochaeta ligniaria NRRL 30616 TaxID=1408157 RepID=A0A1J7ISU5_9PEZI|nr:hypothetical protein CONLIGDRAFT_648963 [Coniochaeta ligniaria NRRL 30616]
MVNGANSIREGARRRFTVESKSIDILKTFADVCLAQVPTARWLPFDLRYPKAYPCLGCGRRVLEGSNTAALVEAATVQLPDKQREEVSEVSVFVIRCVDADGQPATGVKELAAFLASVTASKLPQHTNTFTFEDMGYKRDQQVLTVGSSQQSMDNQSRSIKTQPSDKPGTPTPMDLDPASPHHHHPDAQKTARPFSNTPVINRTKAFRKKGGSSQRRSSLGMRRRRASSLIKNGRVHRERPLGHTAQRCRRGRLPQLTPSSC